MRRERLGCERNNSQATGYLLIQLTDPANFQACKLSWSREGVAERRENIITG